MVWVTPDAALDVHRTLIQRNNFRPWAVRLGQNIWMRGSNVIDDLNRLINIVIIMDAVIHIDAAQAK